MHLLAARSVPALHGPVPGSTPRRTAALTRVRSWTRRPATSPSYSRASADSRAGADQRPDWPVSVPRHPWATPLLGLVRKGGRGTSWAPPPPLLPPDHTTTWASQDGIEPSDPRIKSPSRHGQPNRPLQVREPSLPDRTPWTPARCCQRCCHSSESHRTARLPKPNDFRSASNARRPCHARPIRRNATAP